MSEDGVDNLNPKDEELNDQKDERGQHDEIQGSSGDLRPATSNEADKGRSS